MINNSFYTRYSHKMGCISTPVSNTKAYSTTSMLYTAVQAVLLTPMGTWLQKQCHSCCSCCETSRCSRPFPNWYPS